MSGYIVDITGTVVIIPLAPIETDIDWTICQFTSNELIVSYRDVIMTLERVK